MLVEDVIDALRRLGPVEVSTLPGREENIEFRLPAELAEGCTDGQPAVAAEPLIAGRLESDQSSGSSVSQGNRDRRLSCVKQQLTGRKRYPLVLMLEPLFRCNLACAGCGKIDYPDAILNQRLSVQECLDAVDECGAPVVAIAGGEPLIHKEIGEIVKGIVARKKFVSLCTNALLLEKKLAPVRAVALSVLLGPSRRRSRSMHDKSVCQDGVLRQAVAGDQGRARPRAFAVNINCTIFDGHPAEDIAAFLDTGEGARRRHLDLARLRL